MLKIKQRFNEKDKNSEQEQYEEKEIKRCEKYCSIKLERKNTKQKPPEIEHR